MVENVFLRRFFLLFVQLCKLLTGFLYMLTSSYSRYEWSAYVPTLWYQNMRHICSLVGMRVDRKVLFVNYALVRSGPRKDMEQTIRPSTFEWCIKLYFILLTYLATDIKNAHIYTLYTFFIPIKKKHFNIVKKVFSRRTANNHECHIDSFII